jgi:hypothetical protein
MDSDFFLGENDTAPILEMVCLGPATDAEPDGPIVDLTGAYAEFQMRPEDEITAIVTARATILSPGTAGRVQFNWAGYPAGRYEGRLKVTLADGSRISFPNDRQLKILVTEDP